MAPNFNRSIFESNLSLNLSNFESFLFGRHCLDRQPLIPGSCSLSDSFLIFDRAYLRRHSRLVWALLPPTKGRSALEEQVSHPDDHP